LLHFTRVENVRSILRNGLLPKSHFAQRSIEAVINDELRLDGFAEATCLSIGFPNYKMFYSIRQRDRSVQWAILAINPSVLWTKDCAFCVENAASGSVTSIPIGARKTLAAFEKMFNDIPGKPTREALKISDGTPTNPQAEVLVFDPIDPELIVGIAFNRANLVEMYKAEAGGRVVKLIPGLFGPRVDFSHWK
jgi:hypothetical protein